MIHAAAAAVCALLIVLGVALIYPPAGLIAAGLMIAVILFIDLERSRA